MARVACANPSPYARQRFVQRSEEADRGGFLGAALLSQQKEVVTDAATRAKMVKHLQQMLPMDWNELTQYYKNNNWIRLDKKATQEAARQGARDPV